MMNVEDYIKERHNKKEENKKIKYFRFLVTRVLLSTILVLCACIFIKMDDKNILLVEKYLFSESIEFTKINNWYKKNMGELLPKVENTDEVVFSSNDLISRESENYENGIKIKTSKNEAISTIYGGIVVFIGDKDNYGKTIIIQGNNGIDYWYGGINSTEVNLYDYIEKDTLIGDTLNDYLYLVFQKDGNYIKYEEII